MTAAGLTWPLGACCAAPLPPSGIDARAGWRRERVGAPRRVLLLNSTFEPLAALPARRAVVMLLCGKADVVHDDPDRPRHPLGHPGHHGALGHPVAVLVPGAYPGPGADDAGRPDAPRPLPLCVLRVEGGHR